MAETKSWILTDVENRTWLDHFELTAKDFGLPQRAASWSINKQTLHGGLADGVDLIEVDNGALSFSVVPTRGMGVWRGRHQGEYLGWRAPVVGPVHPKFINLMDRGGLGWLQGFDEWIVRCGLDSNGGPCTDSIQDNEGNRAEVDLTLHGRIANQPAHYVEVQVTPGEPTELAVVGRVDESMLFSPSLRLETRISTAVGSNQLTIVDEVTNLREVDGELELLYHCNFGPPLLEEGAQLVVPAREIAPFNARAAAGIDDYRAYSGPTAGFVEQVYCFEPAADAQGKTLVMLRNAHGDKGVVLRFNTQDLPCFTQWKNTASESDGYVTGLEPATNYPNDKVFERNQGRVKELAPGARYRATLVVEVHNQAAAVLEAEKEISALQGHTPPAVQNQPGGKYSPAE